MKAGRISMTVLALGGLLAIFEPTALLAQNPPDEIDGGGRTAYGNSRPGRVAQRAPGRMVDDGLAEHRQFGRGLNLNVEITEEPTTDILVETLAESISIVFEQLTQAIDLFHALLLRRAGRDADVPLSSGLSSLFQFSSLRESSSE